MAAIVAAAAGGWGSRRDVRILSAHRKTGGQRPQEALTVREGLRMRARASLRPEEEIL